MDRHRIPHPPSEPDLLLVLRLLQALAEPTRLRLALALVEGEKSVGTLVRELGLPQSTVSRHLGALRAAEVVAARRQGTQVFYRLRSHVAGFLAQAFAYAEHQRLGLPEHEGPL